MDIGKPGLAFVKSLSCFDSALILKVFVDAPLKIPCPEGENQGLSWWFCKPDDSFSAQEYTDFQRGFEDSAEVIKGVLRNQGPFDGILAFSQGAAFVTLLQILMEHYPEEWNAPTVKFAILVATFRSRSSIHAPLYRTDQPIKMPTLLVYGEADKVIPREMTEDLLSLYATPHTILLHPGGHMIPICAAAKQTYKEFIAKFTSCTK
ncbi:unnamed protein product [Rodentolepis nana]|uniref:FSH1 domain-containing protein n=1 Tax=Rodentolepis nana TaxID=102285 RepID=A0A0R3TJB2_RODNA|nr:unnamed protein product [Rodentolepis nana]